MTPTESTNGVHVPSILAKRGGTSIRELEKSLPSPEEVAEQAQALRAASVQAINVEDVNEMMAAVLTKAKQGDPKCVRLVLDHLNSHKPERARAPAAQPVVPVAPIRLAPAEPPRPVAIDGPGAEQQRRLVAFVLLAHQPMSVAGLGQQCGLEGDALDALLNHDWFQRQNGQVRLSTLGRNVVG